MVCATPVLAIAPEVVDRGSLHEYLRTRGKQMIAQSFVLRELQVNSAAHDVEAHLVPIRPLENVVGTCQFKGSAGCRRCPDRLRNLGTVRDEFLRLEVVLGCGVRYTIDMDVTHVEVRKLVVRLFFVIKVNHAC